MRRGAVAVLGLVASACSASLGTVGVIHPDADAVGMKLIRPGVSARSCRATVLGLSREPGEPDVREALAAILALDPEGNVVANAEIRSRRILTGIYNRRCVEVRGDLARTVATITLPAPPEHRGHVHP